MVRQTFGALAPMRHLGGSCNKREGSAGSIIEQTRKGKDMPAGEHPTESRLLATGKIPTPIARPAWKRSGQLTHLQARAASWMRSDAV